MSVISWFRGRAARGALRRSGALVAATTVLVLAPVLVLAGPAGVAYADSVPIPPLGMPGSMGGDLSGLTEADLAFMTENGISASSVMGIGAAESGFTFTGPVGAVGALGLGIGVFIGLNFTTAWNWYFGSDYVAPPVSGSLYWQPTGLTETKADTNGGSTDQYVGMGQPTGVVFPESCGAAASSVHDCFGANIEMQNTYRVGLWVGLSAHCTDVSTGYDALESPGWYSIDANSTLTVPASAIFGCSTSADVGSSFAGLDAVGRLSSGAMCTACQPNEYVPGYVPAATYVVHVDASCQDSAGAIVHVVADSVGFAQFDPSPPPIPAIACAAGSIIVAYHVSEVGGGNTVPMVDWTAPAAVASYGTDYPDCVSQVCTLDLLKLDAASGTWVDCLDSSTDCAYWQNDSNKTADYECTYGGYAVALSECDAYTVTFDPPVTSTTGTATPTKPVYSSPTTGTDPTPVSTPTTGDSSCPPPLHWGLSLVSPWWYYHVGQCVLQWAFVPDPTAVTSDIKTVKGAFDSSGVGEVTGYVGGFFTPITNLASQGSGDCEGLSLSIDFSLPMAGQDHPYSMDDMHPFSSCSGLAKYVNDFYMPLITAIIYLGGFMVGAKIFLGAVGINVPWNTDDGMAEFYESDAWKNRYR